MTLWRSAGGLRTVALVGLTLVGLRALQMIMVSWLAEPGENVADRLLVWDAGWFLDIAERGYPQGYSYDDGEMVGNGFAFFPLFPMLIRAVASAGLPAADAALLVSGTAGVLAGILVYLLGVALWSRRAGLLFMLLVCGQPMAVSLVMGYTEPLFLAAVAGTFLAAYQRVWWAAGIAGVAAALTRPTGAAVALALAVAVLLLWRQRRAQMVVAAQAAGMSAAGASIVQAAKGVPRADPAMPAWNAPSLPGLGAAAWRRKEEGEVPPQGLMNVAAERVGAAGGVGGSAERARMRLVGMDPESGRRRGFAAYLPTSATADTNWFAGGRKGGARAVTRGELVAAAIAAACALVAGPAYLAWVGWQVGEWDAWFRVQTAGWGSTLDFGRSVWTFLIETLRGNGGTVEMVTAWVIVGAVVMCVVASFDRIWPPLLVYGLIGLTLVLAQAGYWHSKPRLLVPVLLLAAAPLAKGLAQLPLRTALGLVALWSAFGLWFGAYMITIWPFTI